MNLDNTTQTQEDAHLGTQDGAVKDDEECPHGEIWAVHAHLEVNAGTSTAQINRCALTRSLPTRGDRVTLSFLS